MAIIYNPLTITDSLALNIDFANSKSYPGSGSVTVDTVRGATGTLINPTYYSYDSATKSINFTRDSASVIGGYHTITLSGDLTSTNFLYNDHSMEVVAKINNFAPSNLNANEGGNCLISYQGYHSGIIYSSTALRYELWNGSSQTALSFSPIPSASTWFHLVATRSGSVTNLYINGAFSASASYSTASGNPGVTNNFKFSNGNPSTGPYAYYTQSNVAVGRLYKKALSAAEVLKNFNAIRGRYGL